MQIYLGENLWNSFSFLCTQYILFHWLEKKNLRKDGLCGKGQTRPRLTVTQKPNKMRKAVGEEEREDYIEDT